MPIAISLFVFANCVTVRLPYPVDAHLLMILMPVCIYALSLKRLKWFAALVLGVGFTAGAIDKELSLRDISQLEGLDLTVVGEIASLPVRREGIDQFMFKPHAGPLAGRNIRLSWYRQLGAAPEPIPGQIWQFTVQVNRASGLVNFDLFDYEQWLFVKRIHGRGYVRSSPAPALARDSVASVDYLRYLLRNRLAQTVVPAQLGTFLALTLGDTSAMKPAQWKVLNATGTTHLLIVSGLHTGLIATITYQLLRWIGIGYRTVIFITLGCAGFYSLIAGWGLPVQRAYIMTAVVLGCMALQRNVAPGYQFFIALLAVVLWDPLASLSNGFWLSFGAVGALLFGLARHGNGRHNLLPDALRAQWVVYIALAPWLCYLMNQLPIVSFVVNMVSIPWVGIVIVPLLFAGLILLLVHEPSGTAVLFFVGFLSDRLWWLLNMAAEQQFVLPVPTIEMSTFIAVLAGVLVLLLPAGLLPRWPGVLCLLLIFVPAVRKPVEGLRLTFLDVGQGLSVLVETRDLAVLYDTGPRFGERFSAAKQIVLPTLLNRGWDSLDYLVVSHTDNDHAGGVGDIVDGINTGKILDQANCDHAWYSRGVSFQSFTPGGGDTMTGNNYSCLLMIHIGEKALLLTGDIEKPAEYMLLTMSLPEMTILSSPHHGSDSSSTPALLNVLNPDLIVISAGFRNRFSHPDPVVLERYRQRDIDIYSTDQDGAVMVSLSSEGEIIELRTARAFRPALWRR
jgi:competence protein ComEC